MRHSAFDINATRIIATLRICIALVSLLLSGTDADNVGLRLEFDDVVTFTWLVASICVAIACWSSWWRDNRMLPTVLAIDFIAFILVPLKIEPHSVAYLVAAPLVAALIIVEVAFYQGWRAATYAFAALNILGVVISIVYDLGPNPMAPSDMIRRVVMLALVTTLILWLCRGQFDVPVSQFDTIPEADATGALHFALQYATSEILASGGIILWRTEAGLHPMIANLGSLGSKEMEVTAAKHMNGLPHEGIPLLFDLPRKRALALDDQDLVRPASSRIVDLAVLSRLNLETGLATPLAGDFGNGWLIMVAPKSFSRSDLRRAKAIALEVARGMDRYLGNQSSRLLELARMREEVARDLHDGVAQSLAGTRFWLQSLRSQVGGGKKTQQEFDQMMGALEAEHSHVRELIERLREENPPTGRDLCEVIQRLSKRLATQWSVSVVVDLPPVPILVRSDLLFDINQIVREAVANAVRHGRAANVNISLQIRKSTLRIAIEDDGSGFKPPKNVAIPRTIGERAKALGGVVNIASHTGRTQVELLFPVEDVI